MLASVLDIYFMECKKADYTVNFDRDHHCGFLGYHPVKKPQSSISTQVPSEYHQPSSTYQPGLLVKNRPSVTGSKVAKQGSLTPTFQDNARQGISS